MKTLMLRLLTYLRLPSEISPFEATYLRRLNRVALIFFWLHLPVFPLVAVLSGTNPAVAFALTLAVLLGPTLAYAALSDRPRAIGLVYGFTAMLLGGVLVYVGQGPMQIEMHFYFFVLLALLAVFGNPMVIVSAAGAVAAHHLSVWLLVPASVFNYRASVWTVVVHTLFVVLESVAACFVARSFFNNVFRLEKAVAKRTRALDERNQDMTRILDNVAQGLVTVRLDGSIHGQRSRAMTAWFGAPPVQEGETEPKLWSYLAGHDPDLEAWMQLSFDGLAQQLLPIDIALAQLPSRITRDDQMFRVEYRPLGEPVTGLLVVISNITEEMARLRAEMAQRELISIVEKAYRDRTGFLEFFREADDLVREITLPGEEPADELKRRLHTLKGNAAMFGVQSVAEVCHELESRLEEFPGPLETKERVQLLEVWRAVHDRIESLLGVSQRRTILVDWEEYQTVLSSISEPEPPWASPIRRWGQVATRTHLERFAELARQLARRLGKSEVDVEIRDHDLFLETERFAPVWAAMVHAVRNAIDHGIETPEARARAGKPGRGCLTLATELRGGEVAIEVSDDGAGFDWVKIAQRARALGIAAELDQAVFASGVSTAEIVTDTSGRGAGMGALRAACAGIGGTVEIASEPGAGTTVRCLLPLRAEAASRNGRRSAAVAAQA
jgi:two-component system, chemotaxis family, sensor kinase CheA